MSLKAFSSLSRLAVAQIKERLAPLALGDNYLGIHIRHGDHEASGLPFVQTADYARLDVIAKYNISRVFVASGDSGAAEELQGYMPKNCDGGPGASLLRSRLPRRCGGKTKLAAG